MRSPALTMASPFVEFGGAVIGAARTVARGAQAGELCMNSRVACSAPWGRTQRPMNTSSSSSSDRSIARGVPEVSLSS